MEHAIRNGEGVQVNNGPLLVKTGERKGEQEQTTGRGAAGHPC